MNPITPIAALCAALLALPAAGQPLPSRFVPTAHTNVPRSHHAATLLQDGRVLLTGGYEDAWPVYRNGTAKAEIYDPRTRSFVPTGDMTERRVHHAATLLANGQVLIAGPDASSSVELYDPAAGTFRTVGRLRSPQRVPSVTALRNGKVLLAGIQRAELYDPATGLFEPAGAYPRRSWAYDEYWYEMTLLADGRVLLIGDVPSQLYDAQLDRFGFVAKPDLFDLGMAGLYGQSATLLADGQVLVAGGLNDESPGFDTASLFDPSSGVFRATSRMPQALVSHAAALLPDGTVLVAGGYSYRRCRNFPLDCDAGNRDSAYLYDPPSASFVAAGNMTEVRDAPRATLLKDGNVLITGGAGVTAEVYRPLSADASSTVTEYYNADVDRYFITASDAEREFLDTGRAGTGWVRTGASFEVSAAPSSGWNAVCRFRSQAAPDASYFYTAEAAECGLVKRAAGWRYEGTAFHAAPVTDAGCPAPLRVLWRAYNNGFPAKAANHRYSTDRSLLESMSGRGWRVEGAAMCVG